MTQNDITLLGYLLGLSQLTSRYLLGLAGLTSRYLLGLAGLTGLTSGNLL